MQSEKELKLLILSDRNYGVRTYTQQNLEIYLQIRFSLSVVEHLNIRRTTHIMLNLV